MKFWKWLLAAAAVVLATIAALYIYVWGDFIWRAGGGYMVVGMIAALPIAWVLKRRAQA